MDPFVKHRSTDRRGGHLESMDQHSRRQKMLHATWCNEQADKKAEELKKKIAAQQGNVIRADVHLGHDGQTHDEEDRADGESGEDDNADDEEEDTEEDTTTHSAERHQQLEGLFQPGYPNAPSQGSKRKRDVESISGEARDHVPLTANGFIIDVDESGDEPVGRRCKLLSLPMTKETTFSLTDLEELIALLGDSPPSTSNLTTRSTSSYHSERSSIASHSKNDKPAKETAKDTSSPMNTPNKKVKVVKKGPPAQ
ncbi:MAG: hypothetical protein LQ350_004826 [Teloschistes chrysophthalmus]|nr:MAG: hypothetical protein LQ350_004826 [Niorma chrysophthalma]